MNSDVHEMRNVRIFVTCLTTLLFLSTRVGAQSADSSEPISPAYVDSLMSNDSLMKDFNAFIDSAQGAKTLLAIELASGNGFFISKNATAATGYATKAFFSPTITYLHKSGLGISASAYATTNNGSLSVYQGVITPSFDIGRRNWSAGISYSRYINQDSTSFGITPMRNDAYVYGVFKKFWLEPGAAFDFSFDSYKLEQYLLTTDDPPRLDILNYNIHAHTMSAIATLQHDFEWFGLLSKNDHIAFTPTLNVLADASNYDIATTNHLKAGLPQEWGKNFAKTGRGTGFAFESVGALFDAVYTFGHFLVDPQLLTTYFINASPGVQSVRVSYLMNVGLVF